MDLYLWLAVVYVASVITSYAIGTVGLTNLENDVKNLHLQSPVSVAPVTVTPVTPTTSPVVHVTTPAVHVTQTTPASTATVS
jgi:hypothetical protein